MGTFCTPSYANLYLGGGNRPCFPMRLRQCTFSMLSCSVGTSTTCLSFGPTLMMSCCISCLSYLWMNSFWGSRRRPVNNRFNFLMYPLWLILMVHYPPLYIINRLWVICIRCQKCSSFPSCEEFFLQSIPEGT